MENATKALMIAAAVLVAILIISLGIGIFNSASEQMGDMDMTEYQVQQFNDKFESYVGTNMSGAKVNALLTTVFNHNNAQADASTCVEVRVDGARTLRARNNSTTKPADVGTGNTYTVAARYDADTGLITRITVTSN